LEWAELFGRRLGRMDLPEPPAAPLVTKSRPAECNAVRMNEHYFTPDGGYRHLDMTLEQVRLGGTAWPSLRFKLALNSGVPNLEFRLRPDWPAQFQHWPGDAIDQYGPVFVITESQIREVVGRMRSARDAQAVRAIVRLLPDIVRGLTRVAGDPSIWHQAAANLAAELGDTSTQSVL
jgi:hypothetical protein